VLYPMVALNYIFVTISARIFLGEPVSWMRVAGLTVIIVGVSLVGYSQTVDKRAAEQNAAAVAERT